MDGLGPPWAVDVTPHCARRVERKERRHATALLTEMAFPAFQCQAFDEHYLSTCKRHLTGYTGTRRAIPCGDATLRDRIRSLCKTATVHTIPPSYTSPDKLVILRYLDSEVDLPLGTKYQSLCLGGARLDRAPTVLRVAVRMTVSVSRWRR